MSDSKPPKPTWAKPDTAEVPNGEAPRHDTREEMRAVVADHKKAKSRRPLWATIATLVLTGGAGTGVGGMVISDDTKTKSAKDAGAWQQKLDDHISVEREARADTKKRVEQLEKSDAKKGRKLDRIELLIELELDQHKVPKSKRPARDEEDEP